MTDKETYSEPSDVVAEEGTVKVDGPDGVNVGLTPEAAEETGGRLIDQAAKAAGQKWFKGLADRASEERTGDPRA